MRKFIQTEKFTGLHKEIAELILLADQIASYAKTLPWPPTTVDIDRIRKIGQQAEWLSQRAFKMAADLEEDQHVAS